MHGPGGLAKVARQFVRSAAVGVLGERGEDGALATVAAAGEPAAKQVHGRHPHAMNAAMKPTMTMRVAQPKAGWCSMPT